MLKEFYHLEVGGREGGCQKTKRKLLFYSFFYLDLSPIQRYISNLFSFVSISSNGLSRDFSLFGKLGSDSV